MKTHIIFFSLFVVVLCSCVGQQPVTTNISENNRDYEVDYLFEHDGCKVYRFRDYDRYVYFTNCNGNVTAIKNDSTRTRVETITRIR
ncbi:MAG: DUF4884 domain-containing protein [Dysgonomonas sp.]|nr:DUF4884 domain-containing protein [Dysgonomonas sp.]